MTAGTVWLVLSQQKALFNEHAQALANEYLNYQLSTSHTIAELSLHNPDPTDFINALYAELTKRQRILDIQLVNNDASYYSLIAGNPALNLIVTDDDTDYASPPKLLIDTEIWAYYFLGEKNLTPTMWPHSQNENILLTAFRGFDHAQQSPRLLIITLDRAELFPSYNATLDTLSFKQAAPKSSQFSYQFPLLNHWVLSQPWQIPWQYLFFLLLTLTATLLLVIKFKQPEQTAPPESFRQFIFNELNVLVFETNTQSEVLWVNGQLSNTATLLNVQVGNQIRELLQAYPRYLTYWQHSLSGERLSYELEEYDHCFRVHQWPIKQADGSISGVGVFVHDISELRTIEKQLQHQQLHDSLTGLPNRLLFLEQLQHGLLKAKRHQEFIAVLALEVNGIGHINKLHDHATSDRMLEQVAQSITEVVRGEDIFCRFSDDEFLIGCDSYQQPDELSQLAQRLIKKATQPYQVDGQSLKLSVNIGIATYPRDARDAGSLVSNAITAMRHARQTGRNTLDYFSADNARMAHDKWQLEQDINSALNAHDFTLNYQPIFSLENHQCFAAEALIRWPSASLAPDQFIPLAEETGLIHDLGHWVIKATLKQFHDWRKAGRNIEYISINLSALQLTQANFINRLDQLLVRYPIKPGQIMLEITESVMMQTDQPMLTKLKALKERGFLLAIDDFGTGFSSLNYLKHLPIDVLKMDRAFVAGLPNSSNDQVICEAIIQLAVAMGLHIVAEGVETPQQMQWLNEHGVKSAQGYFFAKAVSATEFEAYLAKLGQL